MMCLMVYNPQTLGLDYSTMYGVFLWSRPQVQLESSWLHHNSCTIIALINRSYYRLV